MFEPNLRRSVALRPALTLFVVGVIVPLASNAQAMRVETPAAAERAPSAQELVIAADRVRNPDQGFRLTNRITEYVGGTPRDSLQLVVYSRQDKASGQFDNLVRYVDPPRDTGKLVLLNGTKMWFYDPDSKASVRISPQQRLIGEAANGDVVTVNLARDYNARLVGQETLADADRKPRDCWHLELAAAVPDSVYNHVEYWIERGTFYSVKARYYSDSGRLLKTAYFHKYQNELGGARPTEVIILDAVDPNRVTTMQYSDYRSQQVPDVWFQRDFLPHFRAD
jgi:hypothetical protein